MLSSRLYFALEKAEMFEEWAKTPEKYVNDTAVKSAWAKRSDDAGLPNGLAVRKVKGGWEVVHTASGNSLMPFTYPEKQLAVDFAQRAGEVGTDWTRPFKDLQAESEKLADLIRGGKKPGMFETVLDMPTTFPKKEEVALMSTGNRLEEISKELQDIGKEWTKVFDDVPIDKRNPDSPENNAFRERSRKLAEEASGLVAISTPLPRGFEYGHPGRTWVDAKGRMLPKVRENVMYAMRILPSVNSPVESWGAIVPFGPDFQKRLKELGFEEWNGYFLTPTKYKDNPNVRYVSSRDFVVAPEGKQTSFKKWLKSAGVTVPKKVETEGRGKSINEELGFKVGESRKSASPSSELQSVEDSRSSLSKSSDERQEHSLIIEPTDPKVERWLKDQGNSDVRGIDTPRKKAKGKSHRAKQSTRKTETTVRGLRK